jgi:hypothetical protein
MQAESLWWSYWYFHFPNYALSVLFWTLIGRFMFGLFLPPDSMNYVYRWFRLLTDWLMGPVAYITHPIMPSAVLPLIGAFWMAMARVILFMSLYAAGLTPRIPAAG